ncbi:DUF3102 domain-containing protein [Mesorhizobium sp. AR07]|uniref:DUF3102 domain-containing protein n=1 Tax=Mesorhizobium sp. AR07 TaxID=2865838 RepID=UPI00215EF48D|nr:DUF3102 domain-containing protein [Mesorhizobium sp. AR07]UVK46667.1 DUF3102 domain-containing protein [Mesorhizobium sp. AR07]
MPGETRATGTIRRLIDKHGAEHARLVMCILAEGKGNHALIDETSLRAISDLLLACPDIVEASMSELLELFDRIPLGPYMAIAHELRGKVRQCDALAGMLYLHLRSLKGGLGAGKEPDPKRQDRVRISEAEKGRVTLTARQRRAAEFVEIGRHLLAAKASLPHGEFGRWLADQPMTYERALKAMRLAKAA